MQDSFGFNDNTAPLKEDEVDNENVDPYKYYMNMTMIWTRNIVFSCFGSLL